MNKLKFMSRTLEDEIVKEGIRAVGEIESQDNMITGGIAIQSYLPSKLHRSSADMDILVGRQLGLGTFKEYAKRAIEYLSDRGYNVVTKKNRQTYDLMVDDGKDNNLLLIQFTRKGEHAFEEHGARIKRELDNARVKNIADREVRVCSPEDLALPKLVRTLNSVRLYGFDFGDVSIDYEKQLRQIEKLRENAIFNVGDAQMAVQLRTLADIYDLRTLSTYVGFNNNYMHQAKQDWQDLAGCEHQRKQCCDLVKVLIPGFECSK